ncbi:hypothetical protein H4219_006235, partial [Mycoemilia scoparia]
MYFPAIKKPNGMSYQDYYNTFVAMVGSKMTEKGYMPQYSANGNGATAAYILSWISVVLSLIVVIVVACFICNRTFLRRPSFRLSASIALADIMRALVVIIMHQPGYASRMSDVELRLSWFFTLAAAFVSLFITDCIALQLHLTIILRREKLAWKLNPWYEVIGWGLGLILAHPNLYLYEHYHWGTELNAVILVDKSFTTISLKLWAMYIWFAIGIVYCVVISAIITWRLIAMFNGTRPVPANVYECGRFKSNNNYDSGEHHQLQNYGGNGISAGSTAAGRCGNTSNIVDVDSGSNFSTNLPTSNSKTMVGSGSYHTVEYNDQKKLLNTADDDAAADRISLGKINAKNNKTGAVGTKVIGKLPDYYKKRRRGTIFAIFRL